MPGLISITYTEKKGMWNFPALADMVIYIINLKIVFLYLCQNHWINTEISHLIITK